MHFNLIVAFVEDSKTEAVMAAARDSGATGCTVINQARGEGLVKHKSFSVFPCRRNGMSCCCSSSNI